MAYDLFGLDKKRRGMGQPTPSRVPVGSVRFQGQGPGYGQTNLWGMGGPITREQATSAARNPMWNVQSATQQTQPYPDQLLKIQAAKNAGYDPNFEPDVSGYAPPHRARMAAELRRGNERLSPTGMTAAQGATALAGEPTTITNFSKSLDRDFIAAAFGSLMTPPTQGSEALIGDVSTGGQPQPGDFGMEFSMFGDRKKKKRGLFG